MQTVFFNQAPQANTEGPEAGNLISVKEQKSLSINRGNFLKNYNAAFSAVTI
jgi:hypothetical protein